MNRRGFLLGGATLALAAPRLVRAHEKMLRVAYPDKSPPNSWVGSDGQVLGVTVDLAAEVAKEAGYSFMPVALPLPRVQLEVESGTADGMCLPVTPARLKYSVASREPLTTGPVTMFVRRDNPALTRLRDVRSLDDLAKADVTVIAITGNGWIKQNVESRGIRTQHASGTTGTVRLLLRRRGDVIVDMSSQINWILKTLPEAEEIVELPQAMAFVEWHLFLSKRSPALEDMSAFDAAIRELKSSARHDEILRKYGVRA